MDIKNKEGLEDFKTGLPKGPGVAPKTSTKNDPELQEMKKKVEDAEARIAAAEARTEAALKRADEDQKKLERLRKEASKGPEMPDFGLDPEKEALLKSFLGGMKTQLGSSELDGEKINAMVTGYVTKNMPKALELLGTVPDLELLSNEAAAEFLVGLYDDLLESVKFRLVELKGKEKTARVSETMDGGFEIKD